jgi:ArsR family transcriptional regulator, arsenate/arsenite/antimonite-responsive transcriptional repressor
MKNLRVLEQPCCAPGAPPLPKQSAQALADRFKALADPARVAIVNRIAGAPNGELCTCHLTQPLGLSQPTVSHHLRVLKEAGLIEVSRKIRTMTFYRLVPEAMEQLAFAIGGGPAPEGVLVTRDRAVAW